MTAHITIEGRLTADAEISFTGSGTAILKFAVAEAPRRKNRDTGEWEDGDTSFWNVNVWDKRGEHLAETGALTKGTPVVVTGYPSLRKFERRDGSSGLSGEIRADVVAVVPTGRQRPQPAPGSGFGGGNTAQADPWATGGSAFPDEPPF